MCQVTAREAFDRVYASVCEQRGWTCSAGQVEVKLASGRHQIVQLDFFEHDGVERVRLHTAIGSTRRIRADRLVHALELNFRLPHGSFAVKDDLLVLVDTLHVDDAAEAEVDAAIAYLAETADHYEQAMFGPDAY